MAVIDFKCSTCGHEYFEITNSQNKDSVKCPRCGSTDKKQIYGGTAYLGAKKSCSKSSCGG